MLRASFSLMQKVLELHRQGIIQTVGPLKIFDASDLSEAYRYVSKESSIGKAVISLENREAIIDVRPPLVLIDAALYLMSLGASS